MVHTEIRQVQLPVRGEGLKVPLTIEGEWQIIPRTDPPLETRTRKSSGKATVVSIAAGHIGSAPAVKPRRKRLREKLIGLKQPGELKYLDPNWLDLLGVLVEGLIGVIKGKFVVQAHVVFDRKPPCTRCHSNKYVTKWSIRKEPRNISDAERNTKLVLIVLRVQRYFCNRCKKPFTPVLPSLADGHLSHTQRLHEVTRARTLERRTTSDVAGLSGLSRRTVQNIARETAKSLPTPQEVFKMVTAGGKGHILQIDNYRALFGPCTSILLDGRPLELLKGYDEATIAAFFETLDREGLKNITCYVSDMAVFLLRMGRKYCPCATVVADPHHVVRSLIKCFDEFLKPFEDAMLAEYIRAIDDHHIVRPARPKKGKRKKKILPELQVFETGNEEEEKETRQPTAAEIRIMLHTKIAKTDHAQKMALRFLLNQFPDVRAAYYYMQRVMRLYHIVEMVAYGRDAFGLRTTKVKVLDAKDASMEFNKFEAKLPEHVREGLGTFLNTGRKNRDVICAFWPMGWTNADIECQNGIIKKIERASSGSLQFEELRRQWLYGLSMSAILGREKERVLGKKNGPQKKSILELSKVPPPEPVPIEGKGGQLSLFG